MAVIYLPDPIGGIGALAGNLGQALGNVAGQTIVNKVTEHYVDQTKGMDPQARSAYLISKLGERGAKLADTMTQAQTDELTQTHLKLQNVDQGYQNTIDAITAKNAPAAAVLALKSQAAQVAKTNAETIEAGAAANSDNASAEASRAQAADYGAEAQLNGARANILLEGAKAVTAFMTTGNTNDAATLLANDPHHPSAPTGAANPTLPANAPTSTTDPTTAANQGAVLVGIQTGKANQQQLNAAFPPDTVNFTPGTPQKAAAVGDMAQGDIGAALTDLNPAPKIAKEQRAPGVYQNFATYPDGTSGWVGRPRLQLSPTPQPVAQAADGVAAWQATTGALDTLSTAAPGSRAFRQAQQILTGQGIDAGNVPAAWAAATAHAAIAAEQLTGAGGSRSVTFLNMIKTTLPNYTDAPNIRQAKLRAANALLSSIVKPIVGTLVSNGEVVPPAMVDYFNSNKLESKSMTDLSNEYVGISGDPEAENSGDDSENPGGDGGGGGGGTTPGAPEPDGSTASENGSTSPTSPEDFEKAWADLKPGQTLTGPDGKTYTKKAQ